MKNRKDRVDPQDLSAEASADPSTSVTEGDEPPREKRKGEKKKEEKRERVVKDSFLFEYGIADVDGVGVCVICDKEIATESLKPNKMVRHLNTHKDVVKLDAEARKRVFIRKEKAERKNSHDLCALSWGES